MTRAAASAAVGTSITRVFSYSNTLSSIDGSSPSSAPPSAARGSTSCTRPGAAIRNPFLILSIAAPSTPAAFSLRAQTVQGREPQRVHGRDEEVREHDQHDQRPGCGERDLSALSRARPALARRYDRRNHAQWNAACEPLELARAGDATVDDLAHEDHTERQREREHHAE